MTEVKSFDCDEVAKALKQSPKIVRDYLKAQDRVITMGHGTTAQAIKKIMEQGNEIKELRKQLGERE